MSTNPDQSGRAHVELPNQWSGELVDSRDEVRGMQDMSQVSDYLPHHALVTLHEFQMAEMARQMCDYKSI